jgi:AraC-like DNA-binding protein
MGVLREAVEGMAAGTSPSEMLASMRLDEAARLLRQRHRTITRIALDCGFRQPQRLATAFRRRFGITPTQFRRQVLVQSPSDAARNAPSLNPHDLRRYPDRAMSQTALGPRDAAAHADSQVF